MNLLTIVFLVSCAALLEAIPDPACHCGKRITRLCPTRQECGDKPKCGGKLVLDQNADGCCCAEKKRACNGQNEEWGCGCADKVCNQHQIVCIQCLDGCYCKFGFVRDRENGKCIPENQCPK